MTQNKESKQNNSSRYIAVAIGVLISLFFLWFAFRGLNPSAFMESIQDINIALLALGAITYALAVIVIALRWQFLLRALRPVPLIPLTKIVAIGYMGNNVYPFRAGEALRLFLLKRGHDVPVGSAATTVVIERVFDGIVMLSFILIGLFFVDVTSDQIQQVVNIALPIFAIAVVVFFSLAMFPKNLEKLIAFGAGFFPSAIQERLISLGNDILSGLQGLRSPLHLLGTVIASYSTWAIEAGVYWIVMQAFGLELGYPVALLVVGTVNLAGLIPASPGQIGVYEFFASAVMMAVGVGQDMALAYAIVVHIVIWLPVTVVGFIFLLQYGLGWGAITNAQALEADIQQE